MGECAKCDEREDKLQRLQMLQHTRAHAEARTPDACAFAAAKGRSYTNSVAMGIGD